MHDTDVKPGMPVHVESLGRDPDAMMDDTLGGKGGGWNATVDEAAAANANEHEMTVRGALRAYPWAVCWSLAISMSVIMEGYDTILIGSLFGYPAFQKQFGHYSAISHNYQIEGKWQVALGSGPVAGSVLGAFLNGHIVQRYGYRPSFMGALVLMVVFVFISFFGKTIELQAVGQILCGIPWGIFATIGPAYASEVCPMPLRSYLTAYTNMCFAIGQFIGAGVLQSLLDRNDQWSYRIPFAIQWLWPPFLIIAAIFMPESPWHLVRKGRYEAAEKSVKRLMVSSEEPKARSVVAMMIHTNKIEQEITTGTSYLDCFKGTERRRTEIACVVFLGQVTCGAQFAYSGTYFFEQAGMSADNAYKLGLGGTAIAFVGTLLSWFLMRVAGRRNIYMGGMLMMSLCLLLIGLLTLVKDNNNVVWAQSALCIVWLFSFSLSVGPVGWAIPAEVSSTRLRSKTVVLARNSYYVIQVIANVIQPYMMNPTEWNWRGKTGFFWFSFASLTLIWAFFRMPETKSRTYEELDLMFAAQVETRKFKNHQVYAYGEGGLDQNVVKN